MCSPVDVQIHASHSRTLKVGNSGFDLLTSGSIHVYDLLWTILSLSANFGADSSSCFHFRAQTDRQTDIQTHSTTHGNSHAGVVLAIVMAACVIKYQNWHNHHFDGWVKPGTVRVHSH